MRPFFTTKACLLVALAFLVTPARAAERHVTVSAGRTTQIGFFFIRAKHTCEHGPKPRLEHNRMPVHGTLTTVWRKQPPKSGPCKGIDMWGTAVIYRPDRGFRGEDHFILDAYFPYTYGSLPSRLDRMRVSVTVK